MIAIIDYQLDRNPALDDALKSLNVEFLFANSEKEIMSADSIILPDTSDVKQAVRQLHLLNLFSMLRMLNKPVLGIARGFELMCEFAGENHSACLGLLPIDVKFISEASVSGFFSIQTLKQTTLLNGVSSGDNFYFESENAVRQNENTSSIISATNNSATLEKNNFYGTLFLPEKSGDGGKKILENFVSISKTK